MDPIVHFFGYELTRLQLATFYMVALLIGMSKTGVHGSGMLSVPLLAAVFGGQASSGIVLPILCMADVLGLWYYHRHASWSHLKRLFPWAAVGTIGGVIVGFFIDDFVFRMIMALAIVVSIVIMVWLEAKEEKVIPASKQLAVATGVIAGFTSMVGNLAGPLMAVYFLMMRLPRYVFIGTAAWFFLVLNFFKLPFHIFYWDTISLQTFLMDLTTVPLVGVGAWLGVVIVRSVSEKTYRWIIIIMTLAAAMFMLFQ